MSITILDQPQFPAKTLNQVVYVVGTSLNDDPVWIQCFVYIEESPYSDIWQPVGIVKQPCVNQEATIHLEEYLKEYLHYDVPDPLAGQSQIAESVCRRYQVEFFEYLPSDQELVQEYYQTTGASEWYAIPELEAGTEYLVVMDAYNEEVAIRNPAITLDSVLPDNYLISSNGQVGKLFHRSLSPAFSGFTEIRIPHGIKVQVFKWIKRIHMKPSEPSAALLGGVSVETQRLPEVPLEAPSNLTVSISSNAKGIEKTDELLIEWNSNSGGAESEFQIERSTDQLDWLVVGTVDAGVTAFFDDTGLNYNTIFYYRVKAIGALDSDYSNIDSEKAPANGLVFETEGGIFYFRSDIVVLNGGRVSQATDLYASNRHLTESRGDYQPFYRPAGPDNINAICSSHTPQFPLSVKTLAIDVAGFNGAYNPPLTFCMVCKIRTHNQSWLFGRNDPTDLRSAYRYYYVLYMGTSLQIFGVTNRNGGSSSGNLNHATFDDISGDYVETYGLVMYTQEADGSVSECYINGIAETVVNVSNFTMPPLNSIRILSDVEETSTLGNLDPEIFEFFGKTGRISDTPGLWNEFSNYAIERYPSLGIVNPGL